MTNIEKLLVRFEYKMLSINKEIEKDMVPLPATSAVEPMRLNLELMDSSHPERATAEAFVRAVFKDAYDARLASFYPLLMSMIWPDGRYAAIAGVRPAGAEACPGGCPSRDVLRLHRVPRHQEHAQEGAGPPAAS